MPAPKPQVAVPSANHIADFVPEGSTDFLDEEEDEDEQDGLPDRWVGCGQWVWFVGVVT